MTKAHDLYNLAPRDRDMLPTIAIGAAGTGKTYGGVAAAWFQKHFNEDAPNEYGVLHQRRIVTRPNVSFADVIELFGEF